MDISIIGAGKWGRALFYAFSAGGNECAISSRTPRDIEHFVPLAKALNGEYIVFSIATQHTSAFLNSHKDLLNKNSKILVAQKGVETATARFLHEIFSEFYPKNNLCFLSGPSFAAEVAQGLPCAVVVSGYDDKSRKAWANAFGSFIKGYTSDDVAGCEICGAYKNVIAIAGGICEGLGLGNNARASLIARGLVEIARFGEAFGAKQATFLGLSGAGDLFLTASSSLSRNFRVGLGLAKGRALDEILGELGEVAEGVGTAQAIRHLASKHGIYTPIATQICEILKGKDVRAALADLLKKKE